MPSRIESELMIPNGFLALSGFELLRCEVRVRLQTWEPDYEYLSLIFPNAKLSSICTTHDADDPLEFPWDIVGFDSDEMGNSKWRFTLTTHVLEIGFDSVWPTIST